MQNGRIGFWNESLGDPRLRPGLPGGRDADVCIVGAGYTGLWTAYWLRRLAPHLDVVVVESEFAGYGASGRNGGWLSGLMPGNRELLARGPGGREDVVALQRTLADAVDDVISLCAQEHIDAEIRKGGTLQVARTPAEWKRLRAGLVEDRRWGVGPDDAWPVSAEEVTDRVGVAGAVGGRFSPHCARIQPARLARGLASVVEQRGATVHEQTSVTSIGGHVVRTTRGDVRAGVIVRATEGFTAGLPGLARALLPMNSSMIVTEPLPADTWAEIGWDGAETLNTASHAYLYAQRTADGRIALGGRGVPYRFGSRTDRGGVVTSSTVGALTRGLVDLWPAAGGRGARGATGPGGVGMAHAWCGVLGVARDWCPSVGFDRAAGMAWAGGYVGDGVTTSHVAGRTLAELIAGEDTPRTRLPWVNHVSRSWEPEPWRWLGVRTVYGLLRTADRADERAARGPGGWSVPARAAAALAGRISGM